MGKCFLHGNGGGASLNFKVVGSTTAPASPSENTIWVNTSDKITGWIFSHNEPKHPMEGMVWFKISTSGSATFNALKRNGIEISPSSASQYTGGAWKNVTAQSYQDGQWVNWAMALVSGGSFAAEMGESKYVGQYGNLYTTVTPLDNGGVKITGAGGSGYLAHTFENVVDVTAYSKMRVKTGAVVSSYVNIGLSKINNDVSITYTKDVSEDLASNSEIVLDISALSGDYYLVIGFNSLQTSTRSVELLEVNFE